MSHWVRDGDAPDEIKVSFVVKQSEHPELIEWLWGLGFRKQSSCIRAVLSDACKMVSARPKISPPEKLDAKPIISEPKNSFTSPLSISTVNPNNQLAQTSNTSTTMTDAAAEILRKMQGEF